MGQSAIVSYSWTVRVVVAVGTWGGSAPQTVGPLRGPVPFTRGMIARIDTPVVTLASFDLRVAGLSC